MSELSQKQFKAIIESKRLGREMQSDVPEIADYFRNGYSIPQIVKELGLETRYNVPYDIARTAVNSALTGNRGFINSPAYEGLIPKYESDKIIYKTRVKNAMSNLDNGKAAVMGAEGGGIASENKLGVHGLSSDERKRFGKMGGDYAYKKKLGIFAMSADERKNVINKGLIKRGNIPWFDREHHDNYCNLSEIEYAYNLSQNPEYRRGKFVKNAVIADKLNKEFHNGQDIRKDHGVKQNLRKFRQKKGIYSITNNPLT